ncbi:unnamed protein product [Toxocara canis]|uniref:G_PROTEIN_RECEP_F1_2 domain-containing protein n=1 Tax=Toxocara canis TaxID=6265 RepID=A0A183URQ7_TOXCA|nr:unnamed protein product [Toxocara canis]
MNRTVIRWGEAMAVHRCADQPTANREQSAIFSLSRSTERAMAAMISYVYRRILMERYLSVLNCGVVFLLANITMVASFLDSRSSQTALIYARSGGVMLKRWMAWSYKWVSNRQEKPTIIYNTMVKDRTDRFMANSRALEESEIPSTMSATMYW